MTRLWIPLVLAALPAFAQAGRTVLDGVYTDAQAKRPEGDYRDILAFLLQANGYPAGSAELAAPDAIQLVGKDGSKPLPTNALVVAVGCFESAGPDAGMLTRVPPLARTRTADVVILHAQDLAAGPVATIHIPHRVPIGFHGNWIPDSELEQPRGTLG